MATHQVCFKLTQPHFFLGASLIKTTTQNQKNETQSMLVVWGLISSQVITKIKGRIDC
jgi:hypothetical protein